MEVTAAYAEKHGVFQLFEGLLQSLIVTKPDDPIAHLIDLVSAPPKDTAQASKAPKGLPRLLLLISKFAEPAPSATHWTTTRTRVRQVVKNSLELCPLVVR